MFNTPQPNIWHNGIQFQYQFITANFNLLFNALKNKCHSICSEINFSLLDFQFKDFYLYFILTPITMSRVLALCTVAIWGNVSEIGGKPAILIGYKSVQNFVGWVGIMLNIRKQVSSRFLKDIRLFRFFSFCPVSFKPQVRQQQL